jgi:hypothetical protein
VFTRSGSVWTQQGPKLTGSGLSGIEEAGFAVALSADGNTALLGLPADADNIGAALVSGRSSAGTRGVAEGAAARAARRRANPTRTALRESAPTFGLAKHRDLLLRAEEVDSDSCGDPGSRLEPSTPSLP